MRLYLGIPVVLLALLIAASGTAAITRCALPPNPQRACVTCENANYPALGKPPHCLTGSRGRVAGARSSTVGAGRRLRHGELASE